ncbi:MAG: T9SS type A sorting domain-containing protein [Flavobacteriales bacterium]
MKRKVTHVRRKGRDILALATLVMPALLWAQVSLYEFSQSVGNYTEITAADGGYSLGVPSYWPHVNNNRAWVNNPFNDPDGQVTMSGYLNPATGPGYPIGFDFTFNGDVFDVIGISNGGWISFGKSDDGNQAVWVYNWNGTSNGDPFVQFVGPGAEPGPIPTYRRNRVAGFGNSSLQQVDWTSLEPPGQYSNLRVATIGTAPNRVCVIQWEDYGLRGDVTVAMNKINFQIRLNEADNSVEVVFGPQDWASSLGRYQRSQCGLAGRLREDFNGRMTEYVEPAFLYDWNTTVPAENYLDYCQFQAPQFGQPNGSGIPPVEGLTWRWDPPVCPPPTWPLTIDQISFDAAHAQWEANAAGEYEYFVSTADSVTGPEVTSGTTTDTEEFFFGLEAGTTYYVFVRSICVGEPGAWTPPVSFTTFRGGMVVCDGTVVTEDYCSQQYNTVDWNYISSDGSPLKIEFLSGYIGSAGNEAFQLWNGPAVGAPTSTFTGDLTGQFFLASSGQISIRLITDAGACEAQPWYLPLQWRVGCKNCTDPLVNFNLGTVDCDNEEYYVDVNVFSMGSATSLSLENDLGVPSIVVSTTGVHAVGPFPAGQSVVVTAQNPDNVMCYSASAPIINDPCVTIGCGPTPYTYCYHDNEYRQWAYQGATGQEIGIRFLEGNMGLGDVGRVYNGLDILNVTPVNLPNFGSFLNKLYTSGAPSTDRALVMELIADNAMSCQDEDPLFGTSAPWKWVVACYDGCVQPKATFTSNCLSSTQFEVTVNITDIGSTGSVAITNNGGAAPVTATAIGAYTVGPFQSGTPVTLNVEGASVLCTWTSPAQDPDCSGVGIAEQQADGLSIHPNPSNGTFQLELPRAINGGAIVEIMDLTGRVVAQRSVNANNSGTTLHLEHLPNGLYSVVIQGNDRRYTAKISIQH